MPLPESANAVVVTTSHPEPSFDVSISKGRDRIIVTLSGILDETSVGEFRRAFLPVFETTERLVVVDVTGVPLIDSDGVGALINVQKRLTEKERSLALAGCQEAVRIALALTRLEVLFPSYPTADRVPARK
jgi:anti-sigma B factor antagonist